MKIKAAFVLLALVAFAGLLQCADARRGVPLTCKRINIQHCDEDGRCTIKPVSCCGKKCVELVPPPGMDLMEDYESVNTDTSADARQLFGQRTAIWTVLDSNRRLRKCKRGGRCRGCRQVNIQRCDHAGICTMNTVQCCGKKCNPPPPGGPPPPPPPAMDLMEDFESVGYRNMDDDEEYGTSLGMDDDEEDNYGYGCMWQCLEEDLSKRTCKRRCRGSRDDEMEDDDDFESVAGINRSSGLKASRS